MKTTEYQFNGQSFTCRIVKDNQDSDLIIGSLELEKAIHPGEFGDANDGFANKEAEEIYDEIFYFTGSRNLLLSDDELKELLKREHPDWFNSLYLQ